jgi:glutamate receptor, ionotropic, invertebrate
VLAERENDIDFTVPFYDLVGLSILMKRSEVETSLFKFLKARDNDLHFTEKTII